MNFEDLNKEIIGYYDVFNEALNKAKRQRSFNYGVTQWSAEQSSLLRNFKLEPLTQNIIAKHIKSAVAEFSANIPGLIAKGKTKEASSIKTKIYNCLIKEVMSSNKPAQINCYEGILRTGMATAIYLKTEYTNNHDMRQCIEMQSIDYETLYFDPSASKETKEDGQYIGYLVRMPKEEYSRRFPGAEFSDFDVNSVNSSKADIWVFRGSDTEVIVAHHFKKVYGKKKTIYRTNFGNIIEDKEDLMDGEVIASDRIITEMTVKGYILNGQEILEQREYPISELPIVVCQGYQALIDGEIYPYSFGHELQSMQRLNNMILTQVGGMITYMRKNTTVWDKSHLKDVANATKNNIEQRDIFIDLKGGNVAPPIRWNAQELPQSILSLYSNVANYMNETLGRYESSQGNGANQQSGIAKSLDITQANLPIYYYIRPYLSMLDRIGKLLEKLIPVIYVDKKSFNIDDNWYSINDEDENSLQFNSDNYDDSAYEICIDSGASFEVQRQRYLESMLAIFKDSPPELKTLLAPSIFDLMNVPNLPEINDIYNKYLALSNPQLYPIMQEKDPEKVKQMIAQMQQMQSQASQNQQMSEAQKMQFQQELQAAELHLKQQEIQLEQERIEIQKQKQTGEDLANAGKYQLEIEKIEQDKKLNQTKVITDIAKADAEIKKARLDALSKS